MVPSIHAKAAHLLSLLVAEHPFVDGTKRTALNTVAVLYILDGNDFDHGDEQIRHILREFATDSEAVEMKEMIAYCRTNTRSSEG